MLARALKVLHSGKGEATKLGEILQIRCTDWLGLSRRDAFVEYSSIIDSDVLEFWAKTRFLTIISKTMMDDLNRNRWPRWFLISAKEHAGHQRDSTTLYERVLANASEGRLLQMDCIRDVLDSLIALTFAQSTRLLFHRNCKFLGRNWAEHSCFEANSSNAPEIDKESMRSFEELFEEFLRSL
jgi:hypothetical protein